MGISGLLRTVPYERRDVRFTSLELIFGSQSDDTLEKHEIEKNMKCIRRVLITFCTCSWEIKSLIICLFEYLAREMLQP